MMDLQRVCCMCGDVGFSDKLFWCCKCHNRFQHSYCSNFYSESAESIEVCDWCRCQQKNLSSRQSGSSSCSRNSTAANTNEVRSAYSGDKIKQRDDGVSAGKATGKAPSSRPTTRRYKLLKDVIS